jgi:ABC-2 type transport system permease protein
VRRVLDIAAKELLQNRRDKLAALFTIIVPVIFTVFLGVLIGGAETSGLPMGVVDLDGGPGAQRVIERLGTSDAVELQTMDAADVESAVQNQKVAAAVVIPEGFSSAVDAGAGASVTLVRVETSSGAQTVASALQAAIADLNASILAAGTAAAQVAAETGKPVDEALLSAARVAADAHLAAPVATVELVKAGTVAEMAGGFDQSSTGSLVNWVLFSLLSITTAMVFERRRGLLRRLSIAGVRAHEIIGGKMLAMFVITFLQQVLLILLGQFAFKVGYFNSPLALLVTMVSLSLFAASFGLLISVAFRSEQAVVTTTVISAQLLAALGGAWFPLEITSPTFTKVAHFLPSAWLMDSLHGIVLKNWGVGQVLYPMAIVWIWIVVLFGLAVWRYRPD